MSVQVAEHQDGYRAGFLEGNKTGFKSGFKEGFEDGFTAARWNTIREAVKVLKDLAAQPALPSSERPYLHVDDAIYAVESLIGLPGAGDDCR